MLKSMLSIWLVCILSTTATAQFSEFLSHSKPTAISIGDLTETSSTANTRKASTKIVPKTSTRAVAAQQQTPTGSSVINGVPTEGGDGEKTATASNPGATTTAQIVGGSETLSAGGVPLSSSTSAPEQDQKASSGLSSTEKIGIGVGLGVGLPLIAGLIALIFFLRRRRKNDRHDPRASSAAQLRDQPAMSSAAPALAGVSAMGRSSSKHSLPRTPSQHSLDDIPEPPPEPTPATPTLVTPSHYALAREQSQRSAAISLPDEGRFMSPPPRYDDAPSPMEEHNPEPVSPVSPVSPMGSRPPSPFNDHDR